VLPPLWRGCALALPQDLGACFSKYVPHDGHSLRRDVDRCRSQSFRTKLHRLPWCEAAMAMDPRLRAYPSSRPIFRHRTRLWHTPGGPLLVDIPWHSGVGKCAPFGEVLTKDNRWDIINFLGAFAVGYQARVIEPKIQPGQYWLGPPDFQVTDEDGKTHLLSDYQRKSALLVVLFFLYAREQSRKRRRGLSNCLLPVSGWPRSAQKSSWWRRAKFVSPSAPLQLARFLTLITARRT